MTQFNYRILTLSPCQGKEPLLKYMRTYPRLSMSSLRDCSIPRCALIEAYLSRRMVTMVMMMITRMVLMALMEAYLSRRRTVMTGA